MIMQALIKAGIPLLAGVFLTVKLLKNKQKKIFYLGPILLIFAALLIIKSVSKAESNDLSLKIASKLKSTYKFPLEVDMFTTLKDIKATANNEISYYYTLKLLDFSLVEKEEVIRYACSNDNYKNIYKNGFKIIFIYEDGKEVELGRILTDKNVCNF